MRVGSYCSWWPTINETDLQGYAVEVRDLKVTLSRCGDVVNSITLPTVPSSHWVLRGSLDLSGVKTFGVVMFNRRLQSWLAM